MNPIYSIMESPHRWLILAGLSLLAGMVGAIMGLAYTWPHAFERVWLIAGILAAVVFLGRALFDWKQALDQIAPEMDRPAQVSSGSTAPLETSEATAETT